ncbi:hypothetical protein Bca101_046066 [Brassica carinata]
MDNNTSLMLIDNNGSFEIDDQSHMATPTRPTTDAAADTDDGLLPPQPGIRRRRKKSMVWEHFTIETTSPGSSKACCKHCRKSFAYITGQKLAGTSHLKRHIQLGICPMSREGLTHHTTQEVSDTKDVVTTTTTCPPKKRQRASSAAATPLNAPLDQDRCYSEMAKMIIMHDYPLHMVEHPGFAGFVHALRPQLSMASFHTIHADCVAMYLSEKQKLSTFVGEIPGQVNLTIDLWSSNQSVGYAFVTGHFIDKDWNLTHRLLNVAVVPSPDSDFALNQPVAACLSDWNLERRLCSITVGQSVVNKSAIENLRCCLSARNQHVMNGQLLLGNCYARLLSSMAQDVLGAEDLQTPIKKVRDSVKHVKTKDSCSERFDELKTQLQTHSTKDLRIDNQTKWDTTYSMLLAASEHKEVFSCLGNCDLEYKISISSEEWRKIELLCSSLKILFDAANVLTGPTRLTANDMYHEMTKLQLELSHAAMSEEPDVRNLATPLREKFDEYWRGCFLLLAVAVVMDPRFKMKLIEFSFSKAYGEDAEKWIRSVDDAVHELYHDYAEQSHSLLEAYVGHGNDGFSETEVHFHPEYNHSNELSHDQIYEQPGDSNLLDEKPRDHALDGHESQEAAQTEQTQLVEELPLESQQVEDTDMTEQTQLVEELPLENQKVEDTDMTEQTQLVEELPLENQKVEDTDMTQETQSVDEILEDTQSVEELAQEAQLVEEKHADNDILAEEVGHETQSVEEMVQNTEPIEQVVQEAQLVEEKHGDSDIQPVKEVEHETQPVEGMVENTEPVEEVAQEAQLVEEKHGDSDIQPVKEVEHETQPVEEMVENTEPAEEVAQEAQLVEEKHDDIQPVEEAEHETQPVEEIIEDTQPVEDLAQPVEPVPEHGKNPQNGDSQSHTMPQEEAAFTISQEEGHHVDVLLQEGHHLEASSQEFPLITIGDGFSDFELYISEVGSREQMKSELDQYLEESLIPRSPDFEVLGWWSLNRTKYPTLSKMAADVLSLPFCTVSPDSVFDTDVKKMDNYRSSLGHVTLEALFCAKDWLRHGSNASTSENNMKREP